jgi:hypothetical protein
MPAPPGTTFRNKTGISSGADILVCGFWLPLRRNIDPRILLTNRHVAGTIRILCDVFEFLVVFLRIANNPVITLIEPYDTASSPKLIDPPGSYSFDTFRDSRQRVARSQFYHKMHMVRHHNNRVKTIVQTITVNNAIKHYITLCLREKAAVRSESNEVQRTV